MLCTGVRHVECHLGADSAEGWCAAGNLGASRVSIRMEDRTDGQRTDDRTHGIKGGFNLPLLYRICNHVVFKTINLIIILNL